MAKRKYIRFQVVGETDGEKELYDYKEALKEYGHFDSPKTLYGIDEMGGFTVIFSTK